MSIARSQMNRQLYQMGGEGIMQVAPQQQAQGEQYRPQAEALAQDPQKAIEVIVQMLVEQGIPLEEAKKIAMQMIQAVAEGGLEDLEDEERVEARFGGRIGYAEGGIGRLVDREQYGFGSVFKSVGKAVSGAVKGVTKAVKKVASSPIGRIALTIGATMALGPAGLNIGAGMGTFAGGALRAGLANLAVQAASGQKINFGEALVAGGIGGVTAGLTQGTTPTTAGTESMGAGGVQMDPLYNDLLYTSGNNTVTSMGAGGVDMNALYNDMPSNVTTSGVNMNAVYNDMPSKVITPSTTTSTGITDSIKQYATSAKDYLGGLYDKGIGLVKEYPLTSLASATGVGYMMGGSQPPPQQPGESDAEYQARVDQFYKSYQANLSGVTPRSSLLAASANNPYYAADGGRIGYKFGDFVRSSGVVSATTNAGDTPVSGGKGIGGMISQLIRNNPQMFKAIQPQGNFDFIKQTTKDVFFNTDEEKNTTKAMMADGGRMNYAFGSVDEGIMAAPQIAQQMGMPVGNPRQNQGGVAELDYRDEGGFVPPIGVKERADDIPAMLSNNEFVFTADAVRNAGGGDPNVGAQKMYTLMKRLESGGIA